MDDSNHCEESLTHQLTKVEFITPLTNNSSDIIFTFSFKYECFERFLPQDQNFRQYPTKSLPDYVVSFSREQFVQFQELREAMVQQFGYLGIINYDNHRRNLADFAWGQALEIIQSYPIGDQILNLHFDVVVQQRYLMFGELIINGSHLIPTVDSSVEAFNKLTIDHHNKETMEELLNI